jgi:propionyl-CoA carboxylase alpha chain
VSVAHFDFFVDGQPRTLVLEVKEGALIAREGGQVLEAEVSLVSAGEIRFRLKGLTVRVHLVRDGGRIHVLVGGRDYAVSESRPEAGRRTGGTEGTSERVLCVKSPMPGSVIKIAVGEGEEVRKNQTLVIVEAMKMENEVKTDIDGIVRKIHVTVGEFVDAARTLVEVEKS